MRESKTFSLQSFRNSSYILYSIFSFENQHRALQYETVLLKQLKYSSFILFFFVILTHIHDFLKETNIHL